MAITPVANPSLKWKGPVDSEAQTPLPIEYDVDDPTFCSPKSVLSGLASGYCERRAVLDPVFVVSYGNHTSRTLNWNDAVSSTAYRESIVHNLVENIAAHNTALVSAFCPNDATFMVPMVSTAQAPSTYMTHMDGMITQLIESGGYVTDMTAASKYTTFNQLAGAAVTTAAANQSALAHTPVSGGEAYSSEFMPAYPAEWAKERKWMLDQLRFTTTSLSLAILEADNNDAWVYGWMSGYVKLDSTIKSVQFGTGSSYSLDVTFAAISGSMTDSKTMDGYYNIQCGLANVEAGTQITSVSLYPVFGDMTWVTRRGMDYQNMHYIDAGQVVHGEADSDYCVTSGGTLIVHLDATTSQVALESGGTVICTSSIYPERQNNHSYASDAAVTYPGKPGYVLSNNTGSRKTTGASLPPWPEDIDDDIVDGGMVWAIYRSYPGISYLNIFSGGVVIPYHEGSSMCQIADVVGHEFRWASGDCRNDRDNWVYYSGGQQQVVCDSDTRVFITGGATATVNTDARGIYISGATATISACSTYRFAVDEGAVVTAIDAEFGLVTVLPGGVLKMRNTADSRTSMTVLQVSKGGVAIIETADVSAGTLMMIDGGTCSIANGAMTANEFYHAIEAAELQHFCTLGIDGESPETDINSGWRVVEATSLTDQTHFGGSGYYILGEKTSGEARTRISAYVSSGMSIMSARYGGKVYVNGTAYNIEEALMAFNAAYTTIIYGAEVMGINSRGPTVGVDNYPAFKLRQNET